ncbi:hypothetical protein AB4305_21925 [Nocardia sp. 2YAB30]|uniref:hypothetical protein n=1 Tax=Nocardia sp. 2YAB30 TaxID=3233022 RepID=UPI003F9AB0E3
MARTTSPRPVDIASVFPDLASLVRQTVRLHPRPGQPTVQENSIGGPLLWPADEQWPVCAKAKEHGERMPLSLDDVRRLRALMEAAYLRDRASGDAFNAELRARVAELTEGHPAHTEPNALFPVAQLYFRDIPGLGRVSK